jgi:tRNA-splicing ligase RtcB (3'-phosphate/5'-hydroxy nucleic acid ligase)
MGKKIFNYSIDTDEQALKQFEDCYQQPFVTAAALMPDAHSGYAAPIGSVLVTKGFIVPAWVGFDIGCGMIALKIKGVSVKNVRDKSDKIYQAVKRIVPMGMGEFNKPEKITEKTKSDFQKLIKEFESKPHDKRILDFLKNACLKHLGTLGGGNHFIELGFYKDEVWIIIHSGSRGIGYKVAEKYMKFAANSEKNFEKTYPLDVNSELGKEYLNILDFGLAYALLNRLEMGYKVEMALKEIFGNKISAELWTNKNHNHAILEKGLFIHRKGATPAKKGELGVIPGNMRDGCYLVKGLGKKDFLYSSSHGAGRAISRKKARESITLAQFKDAMKGIKGTVNDDTLDEAPMAYKDINKVMAAQQKSVKVLKHVLPIINWKGK